MIGYIKLFRSITEHWIWDDPKHCKWWIAILLYVNHKASNVIVNDELYSTKAGESYISIQRWSELFGCSKRTVLKFFQILEAEGMIERKVLGKGNRRKHLLSVVNWAKFQQSETQKESEKNIKAKAKKNSDVPPINNNNNNNDKNEKELIPPSLNDVKLFFKQNGYSDIKAKRAFELYSKMEWHDTKGNKIFDWKLKMETVWFIEENRIHPEHPSQKNRVEETKKYIENQNIRAEHEISLEQYRKQKAKKIFHEIAGSKNNDDYKGKDQLLF